MGKDNILVFSLTAKERCITVDLTMCLPLQVRQSEILVGTSGSTRCSPLASLAEKPFELKLIVQGGSARDTGFSEVKRGTMSES